MEDRNSDMVDKGEEMLTDPLLKVAFVDGKNQMGRTSSPPSYLASAGRSREKGATVLRLCTAAASGDYINAVFRHAKLRAGCRA